MRHSGIAVEVFDEEVFYDPVYHGRTLKVFGMDDYPVRFLSYVVGQYRKLGYSAVVFDTTGRLMVTLTPFSKSATVVTTVSTRLSFRRLATSTSTPL